MPRITCWALFAVCILCPSLGVAQQSYSPPITPNYGRFLKSADWLPRYPSRYVSRYSSRLAQNDATESLPSAESTFSTTGSESAAGAGSATGYGAETGYGFNAGYGARTSGSQRGYSTDDDYTPDIGYESQHRYSAEDDYTPDTSYGANTSYGADTGYSADVGYSSDAGHSSNLGYGSAVGADSAVGTGSVGVSGVQDSEHGVDLGRPMTIPQQGSVEQGSVEQGAVEGSVELPAPVAASAVGCSDCSMIGCDGDCGSMILDTGHECGGWFAGLYYLGLWRDDDRRGHVLGFDTVDPSTPLLTTGTARMEAGNGFAIRMGRMLSPCMALEAIYWQVFPDDETGQVPTSRTPGLVNSSLLFAGLEYDNGGGGQPVDNFYQGTSLLEARRSYDYRNLELNLLEMPFVYSGPGSRARLALLAGARYFRGDENFALATDLLNETFGDDPNNELMYQSDVENHLVGCQFGVLLDYQFISWLSGLLSTKVGIYGNHMRIEQVVGGGNGNAIVNAGPFAGRAFSVTSSKNDFAFLAELDAGLAYSAHRWRLSFGYRAIAVSGFAQAISQIPYDFTNLASASSIQDHDSLILHGAYGGLELTW